jgi:hypothetical protein
VRLYWVPQNKYLDTKDLGGSGDETRGTHKNKGGRKMDVNRSGDQENCGFLSPGRLIDPLDTHQGISGTAWITRILHRLSMREMATGGPNPQKLSNNQPLWRRSISSNYDFETLARSLSRTDEPRQISSGPWSPLGNCNLPVNSLVRFSQFQQLCGADDNSRERLNIIATIWLPEVSPEDGFARDQ